MSNMASQLVAARLQSVFSGVRSNLDTISGNTGLTFQGFLLKSSLDQSVSADASRLSAALTQALKQDDSGGAVAEIMKDYYSEKAKNAEEIVNAVKPEEKSTETTEAKSTTASMPATAFDAFIHESAEAYGVDSSLIKALIYGESGFNAGAVSGAGAIGLMQLMPYTAEALAVSDPYDPAANIDGGTRLLCSLLDRYDGDARKAVAAYNMGAAGFDSRGLNDLTDPVQLALLPSETRSLLDRVGNYLESADALNAWIQTP